MRDVPVLVDDLLHDGLDVGQGSGDVEGEHVGAAGGEGVEFGKRAAGGDDVVGAGEGGESEGVAEARARGCDEPDGLLGGHGGGLGLGVVGGKCGG